jgi:hypothetical protein
MAWFRKWLAGLLKWLAFLEMHLYSALFFVLGLAFVWLSFALLSCRCTPCFAYCCSIVTNALICSLHSHIPALFLLRAKALRTSFARSLSLTIWVFIIIASFEQALSRIVSSSLCSSYCLVHSSLRSSYTILCVHVCLFVALIVCPCPRIVSATRDKSLVLETA